MSKNPISSWNTKPHYRENGAVHTPYILAEYTAQKTAHYLRQGHKKNRGNKSNNNNAISELGWKDGQELEFAVKDEQLIVKPKPERN